MPTARACMRSKKPQTLISSLSSKLTACRTTSSDAAQSQPSKPPPPPPPYPWASLTWKTRLILTLASKLTSIICRPDVPFNRRLYNLIDCNNTYPNPTTPVNGVTTSDVTVDPARNIWFRLFAPDTTSSSSPSSLPVVLFFHGGGFCFNSPATVIFDTECRKFSREIPAVVVSVNYRLSPEHRYPSQYDDGFDALTFIDQNDHVLPKTADRSRCFLAGDSAGGNLAHHVAVRAARAKDQLRHVKIAGLVNIQPFFGGEERVESEIRLQSDPLISVKVTDWMWRLFLPDGLNRDHEAVNVSGPNAEDISGLEYPNTLVVVGGADPLQDWQRRYCQWLKKSGIAAKLIEYPNMMHGFNVFPEIPQSDQLISDIKDFVNARST